MTQESDLSAADARHAANILVIKQKHSARISNAEENYSKAEGDYNQTWLLVRERAPTYARWWIYWPFLVALATLEVPVNQLAFQLYFGEGSLLSTFVTFGVGLVLIYFAHAIGVTMRRFRHNSEETGGALASLGWIAFLLLLTITISYSLAILRQAYLAYQHAPNPTLSEMIAQGRQLDAAATVLQQNFLRSDLAMDGLIFFFINVGIMTVGVVASFWGHDPHPDYANQDQVMKRTWKLLQRRKGDESKDLAAEQAHFASQKAQIARQNGRAPVLRITQRQERGS